MRQPKPVFRLAISDILIPEEKNAIIDKAQKRSRWHSE